MKTICMKCQILVYGKDKKNSVSLSSAEFVGRVVKIKVRLSLHKGFICILKVFATARNSFMKINIWAGPCKNVFSVLMPSAKV